MTDNTRDMSTSDDSDTAAGFLETSAELLADMLTTPDSLADSLDPGERTRLTAGLFELLGRGGKTRGDCAGLAAA